MFKGTLIEDHNYYTLRSKQLLYVLLPSLAIGFLVNFYQMPLWITIGAICFIVAITILTLKNQKEILKVANKKIELDRSEIRLKDSNGHLLERISLNNNLKIRVKENYKLGQETMWDLKEEMIGNVEKQFIVLVSDNDERRFDFQMNSYYMVKQLDKVIVQWQNEGYHIDYVN